MPSVVAFLADALGAALVAYIAGIRNKRTVAQWARGANPRGMANQRLRAAYLATVYILERHDPETAQAWFFGANRLFDGEAPASVLREARTPDVTTRVVAAARAFGGSGH